MFLKGDRVRHQYENKLGTVKDWYVLVEGPPNGGLIIKVVWDGSRKVEEWNEHRLTLHDRPDCY